MNGEYCFARKTHYFYFLVLIPAVVIYCAIVSYTFIIY